MKAASRSLLGVWVLAFTFLINGSLLLYTHYEIIKIAKKYGNGIHTNVINPISILFLSCLFIETIAYWLLRKKIFDIVAVRIHVWILFFVFCIMPFLFFLIAQISASYLGSDRYMSFLKELSQIRTFLFWALLAVAHIFFLITIVKCFNNKKETVSDEPAGILDEFIS